MKTLPAFLLVGLLALWIEIPSTAGYRIPWGGICPGNPFQCSLPGIHRCRSDYDCPQNLSCCNFRCGRGCRTRPAISWSCPRIPFRCTVPGIDRCRYDNDCPGRQRCCYYNCARTCR